MYLMVHEPSGRIEPHRCNRILTEPDTICGEILAHEDLLGACPVLYSQQRDFARYHANAVTKYSVS